MTPFKGENRVTSTFGPRKSPITGAQEHHGGQDIAANGAWPGTAWHVRECTGGTVINVYEDKWRGKFVDVRTSQTHVERYQHMHEIYVKPGQAVPQGTVLAMAGKTGDVTGVHLHFEVIKCTQNDIAGLNKAAKANPAQWSGIPNACGAYKGNDSLDSAAGGETSGGTAAALEKELAAKTKLFANAEAGLLQAQRTINQTLAVIKEG